MGWGVGMWDSSRLGLGWLTLRGECLLILPPLSPLNPGPGQLGRDHGRAETTSVRFDKRTLRAWPALPLSCGSLKVVSDALR